MNRRPKPGDKEEDLLAFQNEFLSSGTNPSASLIRQRAKRGPHQPSIAVDVAKDVVTLKTEHVSSNPAEALDKPPKKRSKFKQERILHRSANPVEPSVGEDMDQFTERRDQHITKVLSGIMEREIGGSVPLHPLRRAQQGFPSVRQLASCSPTTSKGQKISLFAQHLGSAPLELFNITEPAPLKTQCDQNEREHTHSTAEHTQSTPDHTHSTADHTQSTPDHTHSTADHTQSITDHTHNAAPQESMFGQSVLVTGEGLLSSGVTKAEVSKELSKIHEENAAKLCSMSREELEAERERLVQTLDPGLVAFLKKKPFRKETTVEVEQEPMDQGTEVEGMRESSEEVNELHRKWPHMDVLEEDKLEWTKSLPDKDPSQRSKDPRFSFDGLLLTHSADLPSHLGLHHHGDDPQEAGYTLNELLHLTRSSVPQQRKMSISTLNQIVLRSQRFEYFGILDHSPIQTLNDAGYPLILRHALDESSPGFISVAVQAIHSLMVIDNEEHLLKHYQLGYFGLLLPSLKPKQTEGKDVNTQEEIDDAVFIQQDLVKGFLRTKLLQRLRYILEVLQPNDVVVDFAMRIITRICRHSLQAASEVCSCPRLLDTIFQCYLAVENPLPSAFELVLAICVSGRHMAAELITKYNLMNLIIRHVTVTPSSQTGRDVYRSSFLIWKGLLNYGIADSDLRDTYPNIVKQLTQFATGLSEWDGQCRCALIGTLGAGINIAAIQKEDLEIPGSKDVLPSPSLEWSYAEGVVDLIVTLTSSLLQQLDLDRVMDLQQLSCMFGLLATYVTGLSNKLNNAVVVDVLHKLEHWFDESGVVGRLLQSGVVTKVFELLSRQSLSSLSPLATDQNSASNLPTYHQGSVPPKPAVYGQPSMSHSDWDNMLCGDKMSLTAGDLLCTVFMLLDGLSSLHKGLLLRVSPLLTDATVVGYLRSFTASKQKYFSSSFTRSQLYGTYYLVKLSAAVVANDHKCMPGEVVTLYHCAAFKLVSVLPPGTEHLLVTLLKSVVFNSLFYWEFRDNCKTKLIESCIGRLSLREVPLSVTGKSNKTAAEILEDGVAHLNEIETELTNVFMKTCLSETAFKKSRYLHQRKVLQVSSLTLPGNHSSILPGDWVLLPIIYHHNMTHERTTDVSESSPEVLSSVLRTLQHLVLLEYLRPEVVESVNVTDKFARLMCVFLAGSDLFLNVEVHSCLSALLEVYTSGSNLEALQSFTTPTAGLSSFYDLYSEFVSQFGAVSYGDSLFSSYLIVPLQQKCPIEFRRLVWGEYSHVIRVISLTEDHIPFPLESFLYPVETDSHMLLLYRNALNSGNLQKSWSPLLFKIAKHHVDSVGM